MNEPSSIRLFCLSVTHHHADVAVRERLSYTGAARREALSRFVEARRSERLPLGEIAILSTCNRAEVYAVASPEAESESVWTALVDFIAESRAIEPELVRPHLTRIADSAAVTHLCRVACGLESMVLGEAEILGQVAESIEAAVEQNAAGPVLTSLFQAAIRAGRGARAETLIGRGAGSVSSVAVELALRGVETLAGRAVAVVGAGRMARKAAGALRARGAGSVLVVGRTPEAAAELATELGGAAHGLGELEEVLVQADIVIASTSAPGAVITAPLVRAAMSARHRPLILIDIAVPRDVEMEVREIRGVHLFDLDDLQAELDQSALERRREVPRVESIVGREVALFESWLRDHETRPLVRALRLQAEHIRRRELDRLLQQLPALEAEDRERLERFSEALVKKLLHGPTARLRASNGNGSAARLAQAARELFDLSE